MPGVRKRLPVSRNSLNATSDAAMAAIIGKVEARTLKLETPSSRWTNSDPLPFNSNITALAAITISDIKIGTPKPRRLSVANSC